METRPKSGTRSDAPPAWWRDWWACDYSWQGLAGRPGPDGRPLQMAWREEAGRLIAEPGTQRLWTRFHCPLHFADGTPSPKASWSQGEWNDLHGRLRTRLALADSATPCPLDGMILDGLDESEDVLDRDASAWLWLSARDACFTGPVLLRNLCFGLADFTGAWLGGGADVSGSILPEAAPSGLPVMTPSPPSQSVKPATNLPQIVRVAPESVAHEGLAEKDAPTKRGTRTALWLAAGAAIIGAAALLVIKSL